jgi:hypothetical protein
MKTNQGAIVLAERTADHGRIRAVLREWGYGRAKLTLSQGRVDQKLETRRNT